MYFLSVPTALASLIAFLGTIVVMKCFFSRNTFIVEMLPCIPLSAKKKIFSFLVDTCPPHSDKELVEKCEKTRNAVELMRSPPVVDLST